MEDFPNNENTNQGEQNETNGAEQLSNMPSYEEHMAGIIPTAKTYEDRKREGSLPEGVRDEDDWNEYLAEKEARKREYLEKKANEEKRGQQKLKLVAEKIENIQDENAKDFFIATLSGSGDNWDYNHRARVLADSAQDYVLSTENPGISGFEDYYREMGRSDDYGELKKGQEVLLCASEYDEKATQTKEGYYSWIYETDWGDGVSDEVIKTQKAIIGYLAKEYFEKYKDAETDDSRNKEDFKIKSLALYVDAAAIHGLYSVDGLGFAALEVIESVARSSQPKEMANAFLEFENDYYDAKNSIEKYKEMHNEGLRKLEKYKQN